MTDRITTDPAADAPAADLAAFARLLAWQAAGGVELRRFDVVVQHDHESGTRVRVRVSLDGLTRKSVVRSAPAIRAAAADALAAWEGG